MKTTAQIALLSMLLLFFTSCDNGDVANPFSSASLIDAPVEGVAFTTKNHNGFTDKEGSFIYLNQETDVSFKIGGIYLGDFNLLKLHKDKKILITDLVGVDRDDSLHVRLVKLLQFLQSLDSDNNVSNGISISSQTSADLANSTLDFRDDALEINDINNTLISIGKTLISQDRAIANFEKTLNDEFGYALNTQAPIFLSCSDIIVNENETFVLDLDILDATALTITLGGLDADSFNINGTKLSFNMEPKFGTKSIYSLSVTATNLGKKSTRQNIKVHVADASGLDSDNDYIPNDIEIMLGMDPDNRDENNNGVLDGLESNAFFGDQFFDKQWHIHSLGTQTNDSNVSTIIGNDLDVLDIYHKYMGYNNANPIIIQVVDSGVDAKHEDLKDNMDLSRSYNGEEVGDPIADSWHGTTVAGIIAARAFNTVGVRGIIPFAKIAGSNWMEHQTYEGLEKAWLSGDGANEIAVSNNSWGAYFDIDTVYEKIMQKGTTTLRDNKGRVYVSSAGNDRDYFGNANLSYIINNRFVIVVAALKHDNTYASYSSPGSNVLVSGYSGDFYDNSPTISTTIIEGESKNTGDIKTKTTWSEDTKQNYTFIMNGTSAATPTVTASIALVLEACPDLTWRDVKHLVAKTAKIVDANNSTWIKNSAGLSHSIDYGYGLINPRGMIKECTSSSYQLLSAEKNQTVSKTFNIFIPDNNATISFEMEIREAHIDVEWVEVTIDNDSTYASDYEISLISPNKTKTTLMTADNLVSGAEEHQEDWMLGNFEFATAGWMRGGFRFSSAAFIDESSRGIWTIEIRDAKAGNSGKVKSIELKIYGH